MPRKVGVGMPKRKKSKVPAVPAAAAAPAAAPVVTRTQEPPPESPKRRSATSLMRAPPPSPGAVKERLLKAAVQKAQKEVRNSSKCLKQSLAALRLAQRTELARWNSVRRAQSCNQHSALVLNMLRKADAPTREAELLHSAGQTLLAEDTVKLRDAQIALLRFQLRRKSRRGRVARVRGIV